LPPAFTPITPGHASITSTHHFRAVVTAFVKLDFFVLLSAFVVVVVGALLLLVEATLVNATPKDVTTEEVTLTGATVAENVEERTIHVVNMVLASRGARVFQYSSCFFSVSPTLL